MNTLNEKQVIGHLINVIHTSLNELIESNNIYGDSDFRTGQIYAYAECLEVLQLCRHSARLTKIMILKNDIL